MDKVTFYSRFACELGEVLRGFRPLFNPASILINKTLSTVLYLCKGFTWNLLASPNRLLQNLIGFVGIQRAAFHVEQQKRVYYHTLSVSRGTQTCLKNTMS